MPVRDVAASFQEAVVDVLTRKAVRACKDQGVDHLMIGGGVAANSRLRALAAERCETAGHPAAGAAAGAVHGQRCDGRGARRGDGGAQPAGVGLGPVGGLVAAGDGAARAGPGAAHDPTRHADHDHVHEVSKDNLYS